MFFSQYNEEQRYATANNYMKPVLLEFGHLLEQHGRKLRQEDIGKRAIKLNYGYTCVSGLPNTSYIFGYIDHIIYVIKSFSEEKIEILEPLNDNYVSDLGNYKLSNMHKNWIILDELSSISRNYIEAKADKDKPLKDLEECESAFLKEREIMLLDQEEKKKVEKIIKKIKKIEKEAKEKEEKEEKEKEKKISFDTIVEKQSHLQQYIKSNWSTKNDKGKCISKVADFNHHDERILCFPNFYYILSCEKGFEMILKDGTNENNVICDVDYTGWISLKDTKVRICGNCFTTQSKNKRPMFIRCECEHVYFCSEECQKQEDEDHHGFF